MLKGKKFILTCLIVIITMFILGLLIGKIIYSVKDSIKRNVCHSLHANDFFQEKQCSKYVKELLNE